MPGQANRCTIATAATGEIGKFLTAEIYEDHLDVISADHGSTSENTTALAHLESLELYSATDDHSSRFVTVSTVTATKLPGAIST